MNMWWMKLINVGVTDTRMRRSDPMLNTLGSPCSAPAGSLFCVFRQGVRSNGLNRIMPRKTE